MLLDIALKSLWRRRLRTILTILGVAVAVQLYITMSGIMSWYNDDMQRQLSAFAGKVYVQQEMESAGSGEDFPSTTSSISVDTAQAILQLDGADRSASSAALFSVLSISAAPNSPPPLMAVGLEPGHELAFLGNVETESGTLSLDDSYSAILGSSAAAHYPTEGSALQPGQTFRLHGETFTIVGILKPNSQLFDGLVVIPLATAQDLFDRPDTVSAVVLTAASIDDAKALKREITAQFPRLQASSQDDLLQNADDMLANQRMFFNLINDTVILVAVVAITVVVFIAVLEQRKEIGTLRAIGSKRWRIFTLVAGEAILLSLLGAILALPMSILMQQTVLAHMAEWIGNLYSTWLTSLGISIVIGLLAALLPAWLAVRVDPIEALRYE